MRAGRPGDDVGDGGGGDGGGGVRSSARCRLRRNVTARGVRRGECGALTVYLSPYLVLVSLHCRLECIMSDWTGQARGGNGT